VYNWHCRFKKEKAASLAGVKKFEKMEFAPRLIRRKNFSLLGQKPNIYLRNQLLKL
jgi:hypothetical protein